MILGFTGTRNGMTALQLSGVRAVTDALRPDVVHHGLCIGADEEFGSYLMLQSAFQCDIIAHPCTFKHMQSAIAPMCCNEIRAELPPLVRNRVIVDESDLVIAAPADMTEQPKGGTWYTVRYARDAGKLHAIIYPDGSIDYEQPSR